MSFFAGAMFARVEPFTSAVTKMLRTVQLQADRLAQKRGTSSELSNEIGQSLKDVVGDTVGIGVAENQKLLREWA